MTSSLRYSIFVNVVDSVCVCSVIVLCAQGMDLSRHMVLVGGRLRPVRGAIDEGDIGHGIRFNS